MVPAPSAKYLVLALWLSTILYVQLRGHVRHKLKRLAADHANVLAPYNTLMYLFSAVRARPYADVSQFPELQKVTAQWGMIRDEALKLFDEGYIRAAASHNDIGFNLLVVYAVWLAILVALYPASRWFAEVKRRRREWWLSYL